MSNYHAFVGTYTKRRDSVGIYQIAYSSETERLEIIQSTKFRENPSFLAYDAASHRLFSVQESVGNRRGQVTMFEATGVPTPTGIAYRLEPTGECETFGSGPCHLHYDDARQRVVVANYGSGGVGVIAVSDRSLELLQGIQHQGQSVDKIRQEGPHAHSATPDPTGKYVLVCDLGIDEVVVYRWTENHLLDESPVCRAKVAPGSGPRHFAFHPNGIYGYVSNEMGNTITKFDFDSEGVLSPTQTAATLPDSFVEESSTADIHASSDGARLYVSNRGHDSVTVFSLDADSGNVSFESHLPAGGVTPRNFALSSDQKYIFIANQDSDSIVVRDLQNSREVTSISIPRPVCIKLTRTHGVR